MFTVTGSPVQAFVDALKAALEADTAFMAVVTRVTGHVSETTGLTLPYVVIGRRSRSDAGAMQLGGNRLTVQLDWWSGHKGPSVAQSIGGHVSRILERRTLRLSGFSMVVGSLTCEFEEVFDEPDEDMPGEKLYHGTQRWACEVHESL
jgi:hypothetical protein